MPQYDTENMISDTINNTTKAFTTGEVWIIVSVLLAVIGGIIIYNTYFTKDKETKYKGTKKVLFDYLNFKFTIIEPLFKVLYLILALALTLSSLSYITINFFEFIAILVFGNIILRLVFELLLLILKLFKDVSELNEKISKPKTKITKKENINELDIKN